MSKKICTTLVMVAIMVAMATSVAAQDRVPINKKDYDNFATVKESANNKVVPVQAGIDFVCSNKDGWYLNVTDDTLVGTIAVAYKIGNEYFVVMFEVDGKDTHRVGDGSGKNGLNHAKVGAFEPFAYFCEFFCEDCGNNNCEDCNECECVEPIVVNLGFIGHYMFGDRVLTTSFYWQTLNEGDMIDWDAVDEAYAGWVAQGGLAIDTTNGWRSSGFAPIFFEDGAEIGHGDFSFAQLEGYYRAYFVATGYFLPYVCDCNFCEDCGLCLDCEGCACDDIGGYDGDVEECFCGCCDECGKCNDCQKCSKFYTGKGCENCQGNKANRKCDGCGCDGNGTGPKGGGNQQ